MILWWFACDTVTTEKCDGCDGACQIDTVTDLDRSHTEEAVSYPDEPPAGGPHSGCWSTWTAHPEEVAAENWVHNLEHGGVVFLYDCADGCVSEVEELTGFVAALPQGRALLTPYAPMDVRFAAVAWGKRLLLGCLDLERMNTFFEENVGQGPEDVLDDPGAECMP